MLITNKQQYDKAIERLSKIMETPNINLNKGSKAYKEYYSICNDIIQYDIKMEKRRKNYDSQASNV